MCVCESVSVSRLFTLIITHMPKKAHTLANTHMGAACLLAINLASHNF